VNKIHFSALKTEFESMIELSLDEIYHFLRQQKNPVLESQLLQHFFPHVPVAMDSLDFFHAHFNLYHYVYKLADRVNKGDQELLYIRLSSCYLLPYPPKGKCRYFQEDSVTFCGHRADASGYCIIHKEIASRENSLPGFRGMRDYYLDLSNDQSMSQEELEHMTAGVSAWIGSLDQIENSLKLLGLPRNCSLTRLKERYRYLAREHHPDKKGEALYFNEIHQAYKTILKWKESGLDS